MDPDARRRALRKAIAADLAQAYTDDEASPPEWVHLLDRLREGTRRVREEIAAETELFAGEPDIRTALSRRDRIASRIRAEIAALNQATARLNLIAPNSRFTRPALDAEDLLRPLYRTTRKRGGGAL